MAPFRAHGPKFFATKARQINKCLFNRSFLALTLTCRQRYQTRQFIRKEGLHRVRFAQDMARDDDKQKKI